MMRLSAAKGVSRFAEVEGLRGMRRRCGQRQKSGKDDIARSAAPMVGRSPPVPLAPLLRCGRQGLSTTSPLRGSGAETLVYPRVAGLPPHPRLRWQSLSGGSLPRLGLSTTSPLGGSLAVTSLSSPPLTCFGYYFLTYIHKYKVKK